MNKAEFIEFLKAMQIDFNDNPEDWDNKTVPQFLEGLSGWISDMNGFYKNKGLPVPTDINWEFFSLALSAATVYE